MKTSEEINRGLKLCSHEGHGEEIICEHCPYDSNSCAVLICTRRLSADALAYIQQLEAQVPGWISVEERLPEDFETVIIWRSDCHQACIGWLIDGHWSVPKGVKVTHWMQLPEPPKEDDHAAD